MVKPLARSPFWPTRPPSQDNNAAVRETRTSTGESVAASVSNSATTVVPNEQEGLPDDLIWRLGCESVNLQGIYVSCQQGRDAIKTIGAVKNLSTRELLMALIRRPEFDGNFSFIETIRQRYHLDTFERLPAVRQFVAALDVTIASVCPQGLEDWVMTAETEPVLPLRDWENNARRAFTAIFGTEVNIGHAAAILGRIDLLEWYLRVEPPKVTDPRQYCWTATVCERAADGGELAVIQWSKARGFDWQRGTLARAALRGHMHILEWLRANNCRWCESACANAARGGQLAALQWLRQQGCHWDDQTVLEAARCGRAPIFRWAIENGCLWHENALVQALQNGHREVAEWAFNHGATVQGATNFHQLRMALRPKQVFQELVAEHFPGTEAEAENARGESQRVKVLI